MLIYICSECEEAFTAEQILRNDGVYLEYCPECGMYNTLVEVEA